METETDNSKIYKCGNGNKTQSTWKCFGMKCLLYKPDQHSYQEAGRADSVFVSFLATNDLLSFRPTTVSHVRWQLLADCCTQRIGIWKQSKPIRKNISRMSKRPVKPTAGWGSKW